MNDLIYLLLGGNMGDTNGNLIQALEMIEDSCGSIFAKSSFYKTAAWGKTDQQDFLNIAVGLMTALNPQQLLKNLQRIEHELGRKRIEKWGERTIDIDIIFYGDAVVNEPNLIIPHPLMQDRRFVLVPLCEIAAKFVHPVLARTIEQLLLDNHDPLPVFVAD